MPTMLPTTGALLGIDYGAKRIGVAISNSDQTVAVPVETWTIQHPDQDRRHLRTLIADYRPVGIVVGLPVRLDGTEGDQAALVRRFGQWLATETKLEVAYWDERHSSNAAEVLLWAQGISPSSPKAKSLIDRLAAQIVLQAYLDAPDRSLGPQPLTS